MCKLLQSVLSTNSLDNMLNRDVFDTVYLSEHSSNETIINTLISLKKIDWISLSKNLNQNIINNITINHLSHINWYYLSSNKNAINILEQHLDKVNFDGLSLNSNAYNIIKTIEIDKLNLSSLITLENEQILSYILDLSNDYVKEHLKNCAKLSANSSNTAVKFLISNPLLIHWDQLCKNTNPLVISLLKTRINDEIMFDCDATSVDLTDDEYNNNTFDELNSKELYKKVRKHLNNYYTQLKQLKTYINWNFLSLNENAISILQKYPHKINWEMLVYNKKSLCIWNNNIDKINWKTMSKQPYATSLLSDNLSNINWYWLSSNSGANKILTENKHKIEWSQLSKNQSAIDLLSDNLNLINTYHLTQNVAVFN